MKKDSKRLGWFEIRGIEWAMQGPERFLWLFEGFVPYRVENEFNRDVRRYFGWHADFDVVYEGEPVPEYVAQRIDGKTVWSMA